MLRDRKELQTVVLHTNPIKYESQNTFRWIQLHQPGAIRYIMWAFNPQTFIGQHLLGFVFYFFPPPFVHAAGW